MFTGIIQKTALVLQNESISIGSLPEARLTLATGFEQIEIGESIAVNGVCLTVVECNRQGDTLFYLSPETLALTHFQTLKSGNRVNLERAMHPTDRLSGHLVQGHVDGQGKISRLEKQGDSWLIEVTIPAELLRYCITKGSIALNGVSLTVNSVLAHGVSIQLIPHTFSHTEFSDRKVGDSIHIEVDVLAKYAERLLQPWMKGAEKLK